MEVDYAELSDNLEISLLAISQWNPIIPKIQGFTSILVERHASKSIPRVNQVTFPKTTSWLWVNSVAWPRLLLVMWEALVEDSMDETASDLCQMTSANLLFVEISGKILFSLPEMGMGPSYDRSYLERIDSFINVLLYTASKDVMITISRPLRPCTLFLRVAPVMTVLMCCLTEVSSVLMD